MTAGVWRRLWRRSHLERELEAELRDHLERQVADYVAEGMPEPEARRRAALELGGLESVKEACRDARGTRWADELAHDLRYAARGLRQSPAFAVVAVLSLALGIGANTAIFSIVESVLLRALPVRDPERLVRLEGGSWTNPIWEEIRDRHPDLLESVAAWADDHNRFDLAAGGEAEPVEGLWVSGGFFDTFGVPAALGRTITAADDRRGVPDGPVAVISWRFWQRRFGGAADVIGRRLTLDRVPFTIVGVTPSAFFGPTVGRAFDVAVPIGAEPVVHGSESWLDRRSTWWLEIGGRLRPGQTVEDATRAFRRVQPLIREATIPERLGRDGVQEYLREALSFVPAARGPSEFRRHYERPLLTLMAVVALVLLIACANVANLLLARASARRHELSVRLALGASRLRLARQLLTESFVLAGLGAAVGLVLARWGSRLLVSQLSTAGDLVYVDLHLGGLVLGFTVATATATALLFGVAPALRAGRVEPDEALKEQGRRLVGEGRRSLGRPLTVAQVALSLVLVAAAGIFVRTFERLAGQDLGFDRDRLLVANLDAQRTPADTRRRLALFEAAAEAAAAVPGVARAAASVVTPVSGMGWNSVVESSDAPERTRRERTVWMNAVTPGWFATYGIELRIGRDFTEADAREGVPVVIVSESLARQLFGGESPVGRTVFEDEPSGRAPRGLLIVGVVGDTPYRSLREPAAPILYLPLSQTSLDRPTFASVTVRAAAGSPALLTKDVAATLARVDPNLSLTFRTLSEQVGGTLVQERLVAMLSGFFGALALLLSGIGLYGTTAYAVGRRRTEIGIRMALGADPRSVVGMVLGRTGALVFLGLAIGAGLSVWASRFVGSLVYGVSAGDPLMLAGAAAILAGVAGIAAFLPARAAARIDPARVLREG
jgi:predicted permease